LVVVVLVSVIIVVVVLLVVRLYCNLDHNNSCSDHLGQHFLRG
jgi:hypothetical protein